MDSSDSESPKTPPKKLKRLSKYKNEWETQFSWLKQDDSSSKAYCKLCKKSFSFAYGGLGEVKRHAMGAEHKRHEIVVKQNQTLQAFFPSRDVMDSVQEKILAAEITGVYHTVKHAQSYSSLDCTVQLNSLIYADSTIASKMQLGRTKASSIAFNVLGPFSIESTLEELRNNSTFFGVSTDASNHGSDKLFPILLRYYVTTEGIKLCLLDFFEDPDESANAIFSNLKNKIENSGLSLKYISCYSADNANVNFGRFHSAYQLFRNENPNIIPVGCPAHIVNNAVKFSLAKCTFDLETLILKTFGHFSSQAKRVKELKDFFNFVDLEYKAILRHVPTRWLSLYPAVERILAVFPALKSYFLSMGEDMPVALRNYFSDENMAEKTECFLGFFHNCLKIIYETEQKLEKTDLLCFESFQILKSLKDKIDQRNEDNFFGFHATNILKKYPDNEKKTN